MFSITPDRRSIHSGGDYTVSEDSEAQWGTKWNDWLFQECVPQTWVRNLDFLRVLHEKDNCPFSGWDFWPAGSEGGWKELGMGVLGRVFERVVMRNLRLLPTVCGTTLTRGAVLFSLDIPDGLKLALREAGVPVVSPPQDRRYEIAKLKPFTLGLAAVTPAAGRRHLTALKDSLGNLSIESRMILLQFVISDEDFRDIGSCTAPLIPVKDGTFRAFKILAQGPGTLFLSRDDREEEIFENYTNTVDLSNTAPETKKLMRKNIFKLHRFTAVQMWHVEDAAWYCSNYIFNDLEAPGNDIICMNGRTNFVNRFWQWISQQCKPLDSVSSSSLRDLWLLPLMFEEYRKLSSRITVLDVSGKRGVGAFLWATADSHFLRYGQRYCLFTGEGFSSQVGDSLRKCGFVKDYENIVSLMDWLVENSGEFVDRLSNEEKALLLQHLSIFSRGYLDIEERESMKDGVSRLSLFREAGPLSTDDRLVLERQIISSLNEELTTQL